MSVFLSKTGGKKGASKDLFTQRKTAVRRQAEPGLGARSREALRAAAPAGSWRERGGFLPGVLRGEPGPTDALIMEFYPPEL